MSKKLLAVIFFFGALAGTVLASSTERIFPDFPDVDKQSYYYNSLRNMHGLFVVSGYENGNFGPNDAVTRGQAVTMIDKYNENVVSELRKENAYLKVLVCARFERTENNGENYQIAWDKLCGATAE